MNALEGLFSRLAANKAKALVAYLTMGDPSLEASVELAIACAKAGADVLELGAPFSDPTADGPTIQRAHERALASGASLPKILDAAARVRASTAAPIVLFTYVSPLFAMLAARGEAAVVERLKASGVDALLVVDLPPEEGESLRDAAAKQGISVIPLVAPTTGDARLATIRAAAHGVANERPRGFAYFVSMTGVTGGAPPDLVAARERAAFVRERVGLPVVIGFGIDGPARAIEASQGVDGVVVGSAIVRLIEEGATQEERVAKVRALVTSLRDALGPR